MKIIALTGSIATGKSTTAALLTSPPYSLPLIDADLLAREAVLPGTSAHAKIVSSFWDTTPGLLGQGAEESNASDGQGGRRRLPDRWKSMELDRKVLGRRVFGNEDAQVQARRVLNGIVHPAVRRLMGWRVLRSYLRGEQVVVVDVPLLFEAGLDVWAGEVVVVAVRRETQVRRLVDRDGGGEEDAWRRVGSQMGVLEKVGRTRERRGGVVQNDGGREELKEEVKRVLGDMGWDRERRGWGWGVRVWGWACWACPPLMVGVAGWCVWKGWRARRRWDAQDHGKGD
ncbi:MAG: hypothetical protein M1814_001472 [Vezdaea aestivalis]|nr:MAG: hypothetical protein M1814_001472 [Vezdaea aestivalis]